MSTRNITCIFIELLIDCVLSAAALYIYIKPSLSCFECGRICPDFFTLVYEIWFYILHGSTVFLINCVHDVRDKYKAARCCSSTSYIYTHFHF